MDMLIYSMGDIDDQYLNDLMRVANKQDMEMMHHEHGSERCALSLGSCHGCQADVRDTEAQVHMTCPKLRRGLQTSCLKLSGPKITQIHWVCKPKNQPFPAQTFYCQNLETSDKPRHLHSGKLCMSFSNLRRGARFQIRRDRFYQPIFELIRAKCLTEFESGGAP